MLGLNQAGLGRVTADWKRWCSRLGAASIVQQPGQMLSKIVASHEADTVMSERFSAAFAPNIELSILGNALCRTESWIDFGKALLVMPQAARRWLSRLARYASGNRVEGTRTRDSPPLVKC